MDREYRLIGVGHPFDELANESPEMERQAITHRIRNIHRPGASVDYRFDNATQEVGLGTPRVLR